MRPPKTTLSRIREVERSVLLPGLRWFGVATSLAGPVVAAIGGWSASWSGLLLGGATAMAGLVCVTVAAAAAAIFEIADRARALSDDPRFQ